MNLTSLLTDLWRASWQASLLAIVVLIVQRILGDRIGGRGRYALWAVVLLRLLLPALPQSRFSLFNLTRVSTPAIAIQPSENIRSQTSEIPIIVIGAAHQTASVNPAKEITSTIPQKKPISWPTWIFAAWIAGISILAIRVMQVCWMLSRTIKNLSIISDPQLKQTVQSCADTLHLRTLPTVLSGESVQTPAVVGLFKPKLLLPTHVLTQCSQREIRLIVMHELAHLKRHDIAGNWLIAIASIVHWFNPLVWLMAARMRADRELACDELVLAHCSNDAQAYGQTLVKLIEILSPRAASRQLVGILESITPMQRRVRMIARFNPRQSPRWILTLVILFALSGVALTDAVRGENKPAAVTPAPTTQQTNVPTAIPVQTISINTDSPAPETKVTAYEVDDLIQPSTSNQPRDRWGDPLVKLVEGFVDPESWKDNGGPIGSIQELNGKLIIQQTPAAHDKIAELLKELRAQHAATPQPSAVGGGQPAPAQPSGMQRTLVTDPQIEAANAAALAALHKKFPEIKFDNIGFADVLDYFRETSGMNVIGNWRSLEAVGIDRNAPVTLHLKDVSFETVMSSVIHQVGNDNVAMVIDRGVITITSRDDTTQYMLTKVYDVSDLVKKPEDMTSLSEVVQGLASPNDGVRTFDTKLIITALPDMHEQIDKLLASLRNKSTETASTAKTSNK